MHVMKTLLALLPLMLLSYSATSNAKSEIVQSRIQTEEMTTNTAFMVELVGKAREVNCNIPYTQIERETLATTNPMVIVGAKLKQWVDPIEFPVFMTVINTTMHCDSEQWVKNMNHQIANSIAFKTNFDKIRKATTF